MGSNTTPASAFELIEAVAAQPSPLGADGTCLIHIIRPGQGLGRGSHFYPADMLQENAHKFTGWNVYLDHESPEAKKARGGLPRSMEDIGGLIESSWWDPSIPADARHPEPGGVVGRLRPIRVLKEIAESLPQAVKFSIRAKATDVHQATSPYGGRPVWMVEGISDQPPGSVDAVTEAGAGGQIAELQEGITDESMVADELVLAEAKLSAAERKDLPDSAFAIPEKRAYPVHDEGHAKAALSQVAQHGSPDEQKRVKAAVKKKHPNIDISEAREGEGAGMDPKELEEALRDPSSPVALAVNKLVEERATELVEARVDEVVTEKVDAAITETEDRMGTELQEAVEAARTEERQKSERAREVAELEKAAHAKIKAAKLPELLEAKLIAAYSIEDGQPTDALDISDRVDSEGKVVTSAADQLTEAVDKDLQESRDFLAQLNPTRVTGQGGGDGGDGGGDEPPARPENGQPGSFWREHLEEAKIDVNEAFALQSGAPAEDQE